MTFWKENHRSRQAREPSSYYKAESRQRASLLEVVKTRAVLVCLNRPANLFMLHGPISGSVSSLLQSLSFPRRRESTQWAFTWALALSVAASPSVAAASRHISTSLVFSGAFRLRSFPAEDYYDACLRKQAPSFT